LAPCIPMFSVVDGVHFTIYFNFFFLEFNFQLHLLLAHKLIVYECITQLLFTQSV